MKNINLMILFGSRAEGKNRSDSDIDIAVLGKNPLGLKEKTAIAIRVARARKTPEDRVDVVDIRRASPLLQFEIARKGELLYGKKSDFTTFQVRAWKLYQDTARLRRIREKSLERLYV
ncbi:MAG: nucleotidyltransferase domain-containing protein [Patescibacteria group bacterium]